MRPARTPLLAMAAAALLAAASARAQIPDLEAPPWTALADTSRASVLFGAERLRDPGVHWSVARLGLTVVWSPGETTRLFVRESYLTFTAGYLRSLVRWPGIAGPEAGAAWPNESQVSGWSRPEVGVLTRAGLPLLGRAELALAAGLPIGRDEFYPYSSASFPLRLLLRRGVPVGWGLSLAGLAGGTLHLDSGREVLDPEAFPSGFSLGAALLRDGGEKGELAVEAESAGGRTLVRARLDWWLHLSAEQAVRLRWQQFLGGGDDRPFETGLSIAWRVALPSAADGRPGEEPAGPGTRPAAAPAGD